MLDLLENVYVFAAMAITTAVALGIYLWRSITRLYRATKAKLRHKRSNSPSPSDQGQGTS